MKLSDLFDVRNGVVSTGLTILSSPAPGTVPYLRPASTQQRTIAGWVFRSEVGEKNIHPEGSLFVSTNGEGMHGATVSARPAEQFSKCVRQRHISSARDLGGRHSANNSSPPRSCSFWKLCEAQSKLIGGIYDHQRCNTIE